MKILLSSYAFAPSVGGLETLSAILAEQFCLRGHLVTVITNTPGGEENGRAESAPYRVVRRPGKVELMGLVRWCDVVLHNNINLRSAWPMLLYRRPWVIINSGSIGQNALGACKRFCARFALPVGVSEDTARKIGSSTVIPNCYDDGVFRELSREPREQELIFLGRLVGQKGVDVLLSALNRLRAEGLAPRLTIVGAGPEEPLLRRQTESLELGEQVRFAGVTRGEALVRELNRHRILVVPSRAPEAFGIVALEGIACGCAVVGSEIAGLRESIGPCGVTFPEGDAEALARHLGALLRDGERLQALRRPAGEHLERFRRARVAEEYLKLMSRLCREQRRRPEASALVQNAEQGER
jgi:glycogen(starch) synthase